MKNIILIIIFLLLPLSGYSLSQNSRVSVLTSDPGVEYYTIFGHIAIRIVDDSTGTDRIYNFGTFDFREPNFYLKFIKGNLKYFLSIEDYRTFIYYSNIENRRIHEQVLDLNLSERTAIFNNLENCYNSSERYYRYDFYYNNCATKVRDIIFSSTDVPIEYDKGKYGNKTFRQLLKPLISENYWIDFGINLVLGLESDKIATSEDYMFLPYYIMNILQGSTIVKEQSIILDASATKKTGFNFSYLSPWLIVIALLLLSMWSKIRKIVFYSLTSIVGLTGLFLLVVDIITENTAFSNNLNIIWTLPSLFIVFVTDYKTSRILKIGYSLLLIAILLLWNFLPQALSLTFLPWILCLLILLLANFNLKK